MLRQFFFYLEKAYAKPEYYIYQLTFYHLIVLGLLFFGIEGFQSQTIIPANIDGMTFFSNMNQEILNGSSIYLILSLLLIIGEFFFFLIVMYELKWLDLNLRKILILEVILYVAGFIFPQVRLVLVFMSLCTLQVFVIFEIARKVPGGKYLSLTHGYILISKVLYFIIRYN